MTETVVRHGRGYSSRPLSMRSETAAALRPPHDLVAELPEALRLLPPRSMRRSHGSTTCSVRAHRCPRAWSDRGAREEGRLQARGDDGLGVAAVGIAAVRPQTPSGPRHDRRKWARGDARRLAQRRAGRGKEKAGRTTGLSAVSGRRRSVRDGPDAHRLRVQAAGGACLAGAKLSGSVTLTRSNCVHGPASVSTSSQ